MASRGDGRPYKVIYSTRTRDADPIDGSQKSRREIGYEYDHPLERSYSRDYRDDRSDVDRRSRASEQTYSEPVSLASAGSTTRIKYEVAKDRNSDVYVKRSNALVIDRSRDSGRSEFEVIRPERRDDGSYLVDIGGGRVRDYGDRDRDSSMYDTSSRASYYEARPEVSRASRGDDAVMYQLPRGGDQVRAVNHRSYKDVEIVEDPDDDGPRYRRGRRPETLGDADPPKRRKSAMRGRNNTPPGVLQRRRSQSVGFYRDQVSHHDVSEERHERPGAEANIAGRYLRDRPDYYDDYIEDYKGPGRPRPRDDYYPGRNDLRLNDEYDNDRRTYTEETMRRYEYEDDQRPAYSARPRYAESSRRDRPDAEDRSSYTGYETKSRREYYR